METVGIDKIWMAINFKMTTWETMKSLWMWFTQDL